MQILIGDANPSSRHRLVEAVAGLGHEVQAVGDGDEALAALAAPDAPRLVMLDRTLPGLPALEVCRELRRRPGPATYVILVTPRDLGGDVADAVDADIDDILVAPYDTMALWLRLRAGERMLAMQEQLLRSREDQRQSAMHDQLTGLMNRRAILERLDHELSRVRRGGAPVSVMIADLDHFRQFNDTYGHQAGDAVLRATAARIRQVLRHGDLVGRYGGEEFVIIAPSANTTGALFAAERIRAAVASSAIAVDGHQVFAGMSIGVASSDTGQETPSALLAAADEAVLRAKHAGRNRVGA